MSNSTTNNSNIVIVANDEVEVVEDNVTPTKSKRSVAKKNKMTTKITKEKPAVRVPKYVNKRGENVRAVLVNFDVETANMFYAACKQNGSNASATTRSLVKKWLREQNQND